MSVIAVDQQRLAQTLREAGLVSPEEVQRGLDAQPKSDGEPLARTACRS